MHRSRRRLLGAWLAVALLALLAAPTVAQADDLESPPAAAPTPEPAADSWEDEVAKPAREGADQPAPQADPAREPYEYPAAPAEPEPYPRGWVRVPATAADLVLVRPAMVAGLGIGAVAFVATLPFTLPLRTTDDAASALLGQTLDALARPLGAF